MSSPKTSGHNSNSKLDKSYVPPLQKKVLKYLAKSEPRTINETTKSLKGHYKSTWNAFHGLEQKKLIQVVGNKLYQGKEFPRYWVSGDGAFVAICEGVNADKVIVKFKEIYPDSRDIHYFLEMSAIVGPESFKIGYNALVNKGKLEPDDAAAMLINQVLHGISPEQLGKFFSILSKYPERSFELEKLMKQLTDNLNAFEDKFKKSSDE